MQDAYFVVCFNILLESVKIFGQLADNNNVANIEHIMFHK